MSNVIVIDREYASGGREIGKILSKELDIPLYDGELLLKAAGKYGYSIESLKAFDEKPKSLLFGFVTAAVDYTVAPSRIDPTYEIFEITEKIITELAKEGPCIFIGRCADHVLKKTNNVLSVFIYASSMQEKTKRAVEVDKVSPIHVQGYISKKDKQRRSYYHLFTGNEWGENSNYDICLNSSHFGYEGCAKILKGIFHK